MHPSCACPPPTDLTCGSGCWPLLMVTPSVVHVPHLESPSATVLHVPSLVLPSWVIPIVLAWCVGAGACCAATSASGDKDMPFLSRDTHSAPDSPTSASGWCGDREEHVESSLKARDTSRDTSLKCRYGGRGNKSGVDTSLKWRCGDSSNKCGVDTSLVSLVSPSLVSPFGVLPLTGIAGHLRRRSSSCSRSAPSPHPAAVCCSVLQCVAVCCSECDDAEYLPFCPCVSYKQAWSYKQGHQGVSPTNKGTKVAQLYLVPSCCVLL